MNVEGDQQQRDGTSSWAVEGGGGRGEILEGEKGRREERGRFGTQD
jgi:hypothetical protein